MEKTRDRKPRYSIYVGPPLQRLVEERADEGHPPTAVVNVAADRYLSTLKRHQPQLAATEWMLVFDAQNGVVQDRAAESLTGLWANVEHAMRSEGLAEKWAVDGRALIEKLKALDYAGTVALADAAERFWRRFGQRAIAPEEALAALGIRPAREGASGAT